MARPMSEEPPNVRISTAPLKVATEVAPPKQPIRFLVLGLTLAVLVALFAAFPGEHGDWEILRDAAFHSLSPDLYEARPHPLGNGMAYYYNPPYVALALAPLAVLPSQLGYALLAALSLLSIALIAWRYHVSPLCLGALLLSPPVLYILRHGQIDLLVLGAALAAPPWAKPLVALAKPQVAVGAVGLVPRPQWLRAMRWVAMVYAGYAILIGPDWPLRAMQHADRAILEYHNLQRLLPAYSALTIGLGLCYESWRRRDAIFLLAASPFLFPYFSPASLVGFMTIMAIKLDRIWFVIGVALLWLFFLEAWVHVILF